MKKTVSIILSVLILQYSILPCVAQNVTYRLERGKTVSVRLTTDVSSNTISEVLAVVDKNVLDVESNNTLIKAGTPVVISTNKIKSKGMGKAGQVSVRCVSTKSVDGKDIILSGSLSEQGNGKSGLALGLGLGTGLTVLFPFGFFFFLLKGGKAEIPNDTIISNVVVADDYNIAIEK
ncbi:MAG: hypothetical protein PHD21_05295 [Flavobacteriales bacterium]|nr:hypothetical protein [Flavobacteriales bacterium]